MEENSNTPVYRIEEYPNVSDRAASLGCASPTNIALLPRNFLTARSREEFLHESTAATVRSLLRQAGIVETPLEAKGERFAHVQENAFEWIGPTIFLGAAFLSQNPTAVSVSLSVIANYLTDFFKGLSGKKSVAFTLVVQSRKGNRYSKIHYEGPVDGLKVLEKALREVCQNE